MSEGFKVRMKLQNLSVGAQNVFFFKYRKHGIVKIVLHLIQASNIEVYNTYLNLKLITKVTFHQLIFGKYNILHDKTPKKLTYLRICPQNIS